MNHRGYQGSIEYSEEDCVYCDKVQGIKSLLLYEGRTRDELQKMFESVIDDYLEGAISGGEPHAPEWH